MRDRRTLSPRKLLPAVALACSAAPGIGSAAAPPSLPPLPFAPFGYQQQLLPGQGTPSFTQPRPIAVMNPMFTLQAEPFGELGHNLTDTPTQQVPHRQPIPTGPTIGSSGYSGGAKKSLFMPEPGYTRSPLHRRPLGW